MTFQLTGEADADLKDIYKYTYLTYGKPQADAYYDRLIGRCEFLADAPLIVRERIEFTPPVRIYPHGRHLIVYRVEETTIHILRVLHQAQDVETALR